MIYLLTDLKLHIFFGIWSKYLVKGIFALSVIVNMFQKDMKNRIKVSTAPSHCFKMKTAGRNFQPEMLVIEKLLVRCIEVKIERPGMKYDQES